MDSNKLCIGCVHIKTYVCGCPEIKGLYCSETNAHRYHKTICRNDKPAGCPYWKEKIVIKEVNP